MINDKKINNIKSVLTKTLLVLIICFLVIIPSSSIIASEEQEIITINGAKITYRDGGFVYINKEHSSRGGEFRGVWVSPLTGDIGNYSNKETYQAQMLSVLKKMEEYNLNAMIFHVRIMNDALYQSKYNKWSSYYSTNPDWDMLPWLIEECHKRGIEFHAWMNPYRVTTNVSLSLDECAKRYPKTNAASNPKNLLKADSTIILNPGIPEVQRFLVNTCMELVENYDVDAIHFDDYFYAAGIDDSSTIREYNSSGLSVDNFRRSQVDAFIEGLSSELRAFNQETGRRVQLGIAPTGVWRNGNGVVTYDESGKAISSGSRTSAYAHYGSPLYADTLKWINEEWIDYILPQTYWAITNSAGPYCDLVKWWDAACKYSKTNLYSSLGLYMSAGGNASWSTNPYEGYQQIMYANTLDNVRGSSIYNYSSYVNSVTNPSKAFRNVKGIWSKAVYLPEIRTMDAIVLGKVNNLSLSKNDYGYTIHFDELDKAKFYVIYRSESEVTFDEEEIIDVIGKVGTDGKIEYTDYNVSDGKTYYYGIKAQSYSLTLGEGAKVSTNNVTASNNLYLGDFTGVALNTLPVENNTVTFKFDKMNYPFGSAVKYEAYAYFYQGNTLTNSIALSVKEKDFACQAEFTIPEGTTKVELKAKAHNNCGESSTLVSYNVYKDLGKVTSFDIIDTNGYYGSDATFIWNSNNNPDIVYSIEYSLDDFEYQTLKVLDDIDSSNFNVRYSGKLLDNNYVMGKRVYYRIKAETSDAIGYSDAVSIHQYNYLGEINDFKVNRKSNVKEINVNEGDVIKLTWSNDYPDATYTVLVSYDGINYMGVGAYNTTAYVTLDSSIYSCNIGARYTNFFIYLKVEATYPGSRTETEAVKVFVTIDDLFSDEVAKYLYDYYSLYVKEMNIYN